MKTKDALKECRRVARLAGLTFKRSRGYINGAPAYCFADRNSGRVVLSNYTLSTAFNDCCSGFISNYNQSNGNFT